MALLKSGVLGITALFLQVYESLCENELADDVPDEPEATLQPLTILPAISTPKAAAYALHLSHPYNSKRTHFIRLNSLTKWVLPFCANLKSKSI